MEEDVPCVGRVNAFAGVADWLLEFLAEEIRAGAETGVDAEAVCRKLDTDGLGGEDSRTCLLLVGTDFVDWLAGRKLVDTTLEREATEEGVLKADFLAT